jgi:hypothetical protein
LQIAMIVIINMQQKHKNQICSSSKQNLSSHNKFKTLNYLLFLNQTLICSSSMLDKTGFSWISCCLLMELGLDIPRKPFPKLQSVQQCTSHISENYQCPEKKTSNENKISTEMLITSFRIH